MKLKLLVPAVCALIAFGACQNNTTGSGNSDSASTTTEKTSESKMTTKTTVEVPATTRTSFEAKYPSASNVTWTHYQTEVPIDWQWIGWPSLDENDFVATFDMDNGNYWVWYDENGNWIGTVTEVSTSGLPSAVNNAVMSAYPDYTIVSVKKENDKNRTAYEIKIEKGQDKVKLLVSENGQILKKKVDIPGQETKEKPVKDSEKH